MRLANTTEGVGLLRHFLAKSGASGIVKVCGKVMNRGVVLGMEVPCEYIFTGPGKLLERLEKCLDLAENPAVRKEPVHSKNNAKVNRGRKRKTKDESNKDHGHLTRKKKVELTRTKSDRMDNGTMRIRIRVLTSSSFFIAD